MKKNLLRIPFLICFLLSLISQVALAQTTIDFNDLSAGLFLTKSYDKNGFNFSINAGGGGQIVTRSGEGYQGSISLYDDNFQVGALTQWTIKKIDGTEFQFHSIFLKEPNVGASTSGTIQGFKNGNPVGSSKTVDFNGLKSFVSDSDFYDIDEIRISAADINFLLDHFTFGPVYSPVDTTPAVVSTVSIVGSPGPFATSISYSVNFNKSVTGVTTDDFQLTTTSTVTGDINSVSGSGSSYTVIVNNISGIGTIRLDLKGGTNIATTNGNIGTPEYTSGPVHTLSDCGVETFEAGTILDGANLFASNGKTFTLSTGFEIESKSGFGAISPGGSALSNKFIKNNNTAGTFSISSSQDFTMSSVDLYLSSMPAGNTPTSSGSLVIRGKRDGQIQYSITKTNGFPTSTSVNGGFFTINFATAGVGNYRNVNIDELEFTIADGFVELLVDNFNHCQVAPEVDVLAPKVISLNPDPAALPNASSVSFEVIFDEAASAVSIDDFTLTTSGTASGSIIGVSGSGSVYTVSVTGISGEGSIRVDLSAGNDIRDDLNNSPSPAFTGQEHLVGACFIETFEDETDGAKAFTGNGITFNLVGNWEIDRATPSTGIYGSKVNTVSTGAGPYSIISTDGHFVAKRLALYVSSLASGTSPTNNGTVKIRGYMGGNMRYEWNQLGGFPTDFTSNNGYFIVDLDAAFDSDIEQLTIDRLEISLGGSFIYLNMDNFEWCADNTAPSGYTVTIDQDAIDNSNRTNVSFTFAGAELGTTYNYTFTSTGGGTAVTGLGTITSANQQITGIDLSSLGDGTITLSVVLKDTYENVGLPAEDTVIKSLNSAPVVQVPSAPTVYEDDVQVPIVGFSVSDPDGDNVMLTFTVTGGTVSIGINAVWFGGGGNGSSNFTASSSPAAINAALEELTFTPTPDFYGTNAGEISIIAFDGILNSAVTSVTFDIIGINDDPTITGLPATITVEEDSNEDLFDISTASIGDIDAGSGNLSLILVANGGVFDVAAGTGMTIHGHLSDSLTLTGNLINLNNYIDQPSNIYFQPDKDLSGNGAASIEVYLNDNGNTGTGGGQTLYQGVISVNITAVNDAPTVANPISDQETSAGVAWSFQFAENTFTDVDNDNLTYSAQLSSGNALPTWLTFAPSTRTFSGTPTAANNGDYLITVIANDGNGEEVEDSFTLSVALNRPKPMSVQSINPDGSYKIGDVLTLQIAFDQIVTVEGTPTLSLETGAVGAVAVYSAGSGSSSLNFEYKVEEGQSSPNLDYVSSGSLTLNGGSIFNSNEIDADLTLPIPSSTGSLSANSAIQVDGIRPTASIEVITTNLIYGNESKVTVTFSEGIADLLSTHFTVANGEISDPTSTNGIVWTFDLTPTIGIEDASNLIVLDNTAVVDLAGNAGVGTTQSNNFFIDTKVPNASIVVLDSVLTIGKSSVVVITFHEAVSGMDYDAISVDSGHVLTDLESSDGITWTITFIPMNDREHASNTFRFYNWRVTDAAGNAGISTSTSNTYIVDTKAPVVSTKNITVQLDSSGSIEITADMVDDGSSDGFDIASMTLSQTNFDCSHLGANTVTLTVTDEHGNSDSAEAIVTVEDITAPVVVTRNITIQLDATGNASITAADIDNGSTDSCGIAGMTLDKSSFDCGDVGDNTVTLTVTDVNGNADSATAIVTVEDVTDPVVVSRNITIQLDATGNASITAADIDNGSSDSCGIASMMLSQYDFDCSHVGDNTVILTVIDGNGNTDTATAIVTVEDVTAPVVETRNITIQLDATGNASISATDIDNGSIETCGIASMTLSQYDFDCSHVGDNTVTLTITDVNGNSDSATAIVTVEDVTAPVVVTRNITIQLDATGNASITAADIDNGSSDTCGIAGMTLSQDSFDCGDVGDNTVTLTVTDVNGNTDTATAIVTVEDVTAPVVVTQNINIQLDATGNASITAAYIDNGSIESCGIASMTLSQDSFDCSHVGDNTVTVTVTDVNGNTESATAIVTVEDITAPVVVTRNITIQLDATGNASITAADIDNGSSDTCGIAGMTLDKSSFDCEDVGDNTVTLTVTDVNGNTDTATAIVTVEDVTAPVVVTRSITIQLDATGNASITAAEIDNGSTESCGIANMTLSQENFDCSHVGDNTVTLTVIDVNGNSDSATAIVTVEDITAPVVVTRNITIQLDATGNASITAADIDNGSTDSCGIASMTLSQYDFDCSHVGDNTVTLTVTDVNGNTDSSTAIVTVEDITAPVVVTQNITIQLDATGNASITAAEIDNGSTDACGIASMSLDQTDFDCSHIGDNTVTLTVTDVNGNKATGTSIVTVEDITAPVVVTKNLTLTLKAVGSISVDAEDVNDGSYDNCGSISLSLDRSQFDANDIGENIVTLTVTDESGNQSTGTAVVSILPLEITGLNLLDSSFVYDGTTKSLTLTGDLPEGTTVTYTDNLRSDAGSQTVTATVTGTNYTELILTANLTITPAVLHVTANSGQGKPFGKADPELSYTATGFVNGEGLGIMQGSLDREEGESIGFYTISLGSLAAGSNYAITYRGAAFEIFSHDSDGDEVPDDVEIQDGTDPKDPYDYKDLDGDDVPDLVEVENGTNPLDPSDYVDSDGDQVPDYVEKREDSDPNNSKDYLDQDRDGVADYVQVRAINEFVASTIEVEWGTPLTEIDVPEQVLVITNKSEVLNLPIDWDLSSYDPLKAGSAVFTGTAELPAGRFNPYALNPELSITVMDKPAPQDISLSNSQFVGIPDQFFQGIGSFTVVDPADNTHTLILPAEEGDNRHFEINEGHLFWSSADRQSGRDSFTLIVVVQDRAGNELRKSFSIQRLRTPLSELEVANSFTPNADGINDTWGVPALRYYNTVRIQVFDNGGNRLFYTENPDLRWDGTHHGKPLPVSSYVYVIEVGETGEVRRGVLNLLQ